MTESIKLSFSKTVQLFLNKISSDSTLLRRNISELTELKKKLHSQGDTSSQGTGNQVTDQETCFAATLEECGFKYSSSKAPLTEDGFYYIYQVNGTQRSIDFQLYRLVDGKRKGREINFDLKHTKNDTFFLNDGWFHENVIYVISWMRKISEARKRKIIEPATFIALGQDIPTQEEINLYQELCEIKKKYNTDYKGVGSFHCYLRFANTYKCERFTSDYTKECFEKVILSIQPRTRPIISEFENLSLDSD